MKKYIKPEIDITLFHTEDIITSSGIGDGNVDSSTITYTNVGEADNLTFSQIWPDA